MTEKLIKSKAIYRFGQFEINSGDGFLLRGGEIVALTPKIFEMLLLLVQNNGRMLSKDEIMETVWADSFVEETNLTSNISRLRKILHAGGEQFIETFPKRGYRFRGEVEELTGETEIILKRRVTKRVRRIVEEFDDADTLPEYTAALETLPNNLTLPNTPIVGREKEIAEVENLILHNRLVTLIGVGGTGKTRLSQEVACRMLSEFADGVFFIALADVRNAELVVSEIAQNLAVKESSGKTLVDALKDFLGEKELLLVADNFEQILPAAGILAELLAAAPDLKILATSRALLHLKAEREFNVPSLTLPLCSELHTMGNGSKFAFESFSENESIKLFTERARSAKTNFSLTDLTEGNAATVAEICHKLDGLPLAIELAAARIKILSPSQILERLANRLKLLTGGARNLPERQQTMRGAIEWSYDLLDKSERVLFGRLAVFAGDFTIEAAESVASFPMSVLKSLPDGDKRQKTDDGRHGEGDYQAVRSYYAEAVLIALELGDKISVSYSLDGFAALASKGENFVVAARLAGAAEHLRESLGFETEPAERRFRAAYLSELRAAFDEEKFSAAYRQGSEMNVEKAVALALGEER